LTKISEKDVSRIWQDGRYRRLCDDAGRNIRVIYGGRPAVRPGCDFQDAVLEIDGVKCCGDIEIHLTSDLWKKHGHHRNPVYNNVILHVAMWEKGGLPAVMQCGQNIPTVILDSIPVQGDGLPARACPHISPANTSGEILTASGLARLSAKSREFSGFMCRESPKQALYRGICRALGYSCNKAPMEKLSGLLPFSVWESDAGSRAGNMALMLGTAGLLPSQRGLSCKADAWAAVLEKEWSAMRKEVRPMQKRDWSFAFIRPANSPLRRLAALCGLFEKLGTNWLDIFLDVISGMDGKSATGQIEKYLIIKEKGYWYSHYDFGSEMKRPVSILGNARAREISVNVILPFYLAYAVDKRDYALIDKITGIYTAYPVLQQNELTRFMELLLMREGQGSISGCQQQGLLHIFQTFCRTRDCEKCPVFRRRRPGWG
jgi:hypothetical protein